MKQDVLIEQFTDIVEKLDDKKASWVGKHIVIEQKEKVTFLLKTLIAIDEEDFLEIKNSAIEMLEATKQLVTELEASRI